MAELLQQEPIPKPFPRLRQDLKLYPGAAHSDGSPSWRILDPARNRFFEIGWLDFEVLMRWNDHADPEELAEQVSSETTLNVSAEEVTAIAEFIETHQLSVPGDREARAKLKQRWMSVVKPWYTQLLHGYLFFRIPLLRPDRFLEATLPMVNFFFTRRFFTIVAVVLLVDLYLVSRDWENFKSTFMYFFSFEGLLFFGLAASFGKVIHELGHAYTAKRQGVRVPTMGVAMLVMWPVLYTDTSETWKLSDTRKQFAIASAGIAAELTLAVFATLLWAIAPEGIAKSVLFLLASSTWIATLALNASPFMRFDGYFLVSDALNFPNLHERSAAFAFWWLRSTFFNLDEGIPEPHLSRSMRVGLIAFALVTWSYRLVVFFGIALMVYHMFFKLLGIFLMAIEIGWFIIKPIMKEAGYLWKRRALLVPAWRPISIVLIAAVGALWLFPVTNQVTAPAFLRAKNEQFVYSPIAGQLQSLNVRSGQMIEAGTLLAQLDAPELRARLQKSAASAQALSIDLARLPANAARRERVQVLQEELEETIAEYRATREELERLDVKSSSRGIVRDIPPDMAVGRWVGTRDLIMRVVSYGPALIEAYVSEDQVRVVHPGQNVHFYSTVKDVDPIIGKVASIDTTPSKQVAHPILSSTHGGDLPAVAGERGTLVAHEAVYRVIVELDPGTQIHLRPFVERGTVRIQTDFFAVAQNFFSRLAALIIRESGF